MLEQKMNERALPPEKREDLLNELAKKETEFIRLRRLRLTKNQFESIRLIGRGAFGEVIPVNWIEICFFFQTVSKLWQIRQFKSK